jgi:hypothetical protein
MQKIFTFVCCKIFVEISEGLLALLFLCCHIITRLRTIFIMNSKRVCGEFDKSRWSDRYLRVRIVASGRKWSLPTPMQTGRDIFYVCIDNDKTSLKLYSLRGRSIFTVLYIVPIKIYNKDSLCYKCSHCWGTSLLYGLHIRRTGHNPPRRPSAGCWVLTTAHADGTNDSTCLPKHGGVWVNKFLITHPMYHAETYWPLGHRAPRQILMTFTLKSMYLFLFLIKTFYRLLIYLKFKLHNLQKLFQQYSNAFKMIEVGTRSKYWS